MSRLDHSLAAARSLSYPSLSAIMDRDRIGLPLPVDTTRRPPRGPEGLRCPRTHRARAVPLAGVRVGPRRRHLPRLKWETGLAGETRCRRPARAALDAARGSRAHRGKGDGDGPNETEIPAIVEVRDDLTSQSGRSLLLRGSPPAGKLLIPLERRDVRVVEGARLESVCRGNSTVGSNPTLSAIRKRLILNHLQPSCCLP
jgi:hypothetical protein